MLGKLVQKTMNNSTSVLQGEESIIDQLKAVKAYEEKLASARAGLPSGSIRPAIDDEGKQVGFMSYGDPDSGGGNTYIDPKYVLASQNWHDEGNYVYSFNQEAYIRDKVGPKPTINVGGLKAAKEAAALTAQIEEVKKRLGKTSPSDESSMEHSYLSAELGRLNNQQNSFLKNSVPVGGTFGEALKLALESGVDLRDLYGTTYSDAVRFKQDLGQYVGKDASMIIPANPVGYGGQFKFDPNFGSTFYRDLAMKSGEALGLTQEQILKKGTEYFADKFASGNTKGVIGFTDFGSGLLDEFAKTAGYPPEQLGSLKATTLKPLYDANQQLFNGLNGAARVESQSSGFFKNLAQDIISNPLLAAGALALSAGTLAPALLGGTALAGSAIATGAIAGGTLGAISGIAEGDFSSILKNGFKGALQGAATGAASHVTQGLAGSVSKGLVNAGMDPGRLVNGISGAVSTAAGSGIGAALTGQDIGNSILKGAVLGGISGAAKTPASDVGGGIDNSDMDLGKSMDLMDQYSQGAYSGLDGPAGDNPANRIDNAMLKVADIQAQQPSGFQNGVKAALPQLIKGAIGGQGGDGAGAGAGAGGAGTPNGTTVPDAVPGIEAYKGLGLISANAYTRAPQSSTRAAAKFDLQKALANSAFKPGLINGGMYGG